MKDNITPEEKLLRLIRRNKKEEPRPTIKYSLFARVKKYLSFLNIHKVIFFVFVISCVYLVISLIYPIIGLKKINLTLVSQEKIIESNISPKNEIVPYEYYRKGTENRQIFGGVASLESGVPIGISNINVDLVKDINLVGIISDEPPQAVIEDKKAQKTYYLTKGQFIGEIQIEDIQEGKIILNYNGQRFELYL